MASGKLRRAMEDLLLKRVQILICFVLLAGNNFIAAAEIAELVAERDMNIQRKRAIGVTRNRLLKMAITEGVGKLQRGWIRGITRPGIVIFLDQGQIPVDGWYRHVHSFRWCRVRLRRPVLAPVRAMNRVRSHFCRRDNRRSLTNNHTR